MKRHKFSGVQLALMPYWAEAGTTVAEVCRNTGISEATFCVWWNNDAGLMPSEMRWLR